MASKNTSSRDQNVPASAVSNDVAANVKGITSAKTGGADTHAKELATRLETEKNLSGVSFREVIIRKLVMVEGAHFADCDFSDAEICNCTAVYPTFVSCDFTATLFYADNFINADFTDCIMYGAIFHACTFDNVTFCDLERMNFTNVKIELGLVRGRLSAVTFRDCEIRSVNFRDAKVEKPVVLKNCDVDIIEITSEQEQTVLCDIRRPKPTAVVRIFAPTPADSIENVMPSNQQNNQSQSFTEMKIGELTERQKESIARYYQMERVRRSYVKNYREVTHLVTNALSIGLLFSITVGWLCGHLPWIGLHVSWAKSDSGYLLGSLIVSCLLLLAAWPALKRKRMDRERAFLRSFTA